MHMSLVNLSKFSFEIQASTSYNIVYQQHAELLPSYCITTSGTYVRHYRLCLTLARMPRPKEK
jgi:hypothetical protein